VPGARPKRGCSVAAGRIDAVIDVPWEQSSEENFKYPQTTGRRPLMYPLTRRYKDRVATCGDPAVIAEFYRVIALTAPPRVLFRPRVLGRLFRRQKQG
jgi:hypothetical protein